MISSHAKPAVVRVITPTCRALLKMGITADMMTIFGTVVVVAGSLTLLPSGRFLLATIVVGLALLTDLLDGTMARISERGPSVWGNFLDSTLDRVADAAILIGLTLFLIDQKDSFYIAAIISIPLTGVVSYARAKAESLQIQCSSGFAERTERLILLGVAGIAYHVGFKWALDAGVLVLLLITFFTVLQRILIVRRATR